MIAICAIFKNEYPFILEWLAYHRCLGVHNYYIADNISSDGSSELLIALEKKGLIHRFPYPTENGVAPQIGAYNTILEKAEDDWLFFIDADEFITPNNFENGLVDLSALLEDDKISAIALNWAVFGSSYSVIPDNSLVIERFNKRAHKDHPVNKHYKSIIRKRDIISTGKTPHNFILRDNKKYIKTTGKVEPDNHGLSIDVDWDKVRINHYVIKSRCEFVTKKASRGRATTLDSQLNRTLSFFRSHDLNQIEDNIPRWFVNKVRIEKESLIHQLKSVDFNYDEIKYPSALYKTALGMGKGHIDFLTITDNSIEIRGWAIDKSALPVSDIIAVVNTNTIVKCSNLVFRNRNDLSSAGLGSGKNAGFNASIPRPNKLIDNIDIYGLDKNGLIIAEIKSNIDVISEINKTIAS